jgi:hypothetical protein
MDTTKLQEAVKELEAEGARCLRLADELKAVIRRSANGAAVLGTDAPKRPLIPPRRSTNTSFLTLAVEVLREVKRPIHISELVPMVAEKRGTTTSRSQIESALVRGMAAGKLKNVIKRTGPGTFTVTQ